MQLPEKYRSLLVGPLEPGEAYRRCMAELGADGLPADYALTEAIAHAVETRYAILVLTQPEPPRLYNFGDLVGGADDFLYARIERLPGRCIAFAGSGPYPVTALLLARRYPDARLTCIENHLPAFLLGRAVVEKLGARIDCVLADALSVDYAPFDMVVVAAMVGEKRRLAEKILDTSAATILLRGRVDLAHERLIQQDSGFDEAGRAMPGADRR